MEAVRTVGEERQGRGRAEAGQKQKQTVAGQGRDGSSQERRGRTETDMARLWQGRVDEAGEARPGQAPGKDRLNGGGRIQMYANTLLFSYTIQATDAFESWCIYANICD